MRVNVEAKRNPTYVIEKLWKLKSKTVFFFIEYLSPPLAYFSRMRKDKKCYLFYSK